MSPEREAIVQWAEQMALKHSNDKKYHDQRSLEWMYEAACSNAYTNMAESLKKDIPPAPAERWPRCKCSGMLRWRNELDSGQPCVIVECIGCADYIIRADADAAYAAFRAAEQTTHTTPRAGGEE